MEKVNEVEIIFRACTHCTIAVPTKKCKSRKEIENFILNENINDWIVELFNFEVENFEIVEK